MLKRYYPQALAIMHEDIWRPLNLAFLRRWPSPQALQAARPSTLQRFFHQQGSRSVARWEKRAAVCAALVPLSPEEPLADVLEVSVLAAQIEALNAGILRYDGEIASLFARCEDTGLIEELPGAGPAMAPRLYVAFARYADVCATAEAFGAAVGVAPVTDQSGRMRKVYRRLRCDKHTRQSFVEWARESIKHSVWARAFFDQRKAAGHYPQAIFRALAYKWTRILWRCWRSRSGATRGVRASIRRSAMVELLDTRRFAVSCVSVAPRPHSYSDSLLQLPASSDEFWITLTSRYSA